MPFSWGAASSLPFLPRLRYRRAVLAPARWNLPASDLLTADAVEYRTTNPQAPGGNPRWPNPSPRPGDPNAHWSTSSASDRADFNPINQDLIDVFLAQLTVGVLGVLVAAGEYGTGLIRVTFAAIPRRLPVLVAKASVLAAVTFAVSLVTVLLTFVGGQALLGSHGIGVGQPEAVRAVLLPGHQGYTYC